MSLRSLVLPLSLFVAAACVAAGDVEVENLIVRSMSYIDNPDLARRDFKSAIDLCESDTNRFARILANVAQSDNPLVAEGAIEKLGFYGTVDQLSFLYSQVTNQVNGAEAVGSILLIEGVTSNSVAVVETYLSLTNMPMPSREDLCLSLLDRRGGVSLEMSNLVEQCAYRFFAKDWVYSGWYDNMVCARLPGYRISKRRLRVLRSVSELGLNKYNEMFITNAINELVAYPEADLPD